MNLYELTDILKTEFGSNIPVFFHHVLLQENEELPVPYMITNAEELTPFRADDCNYFQFVRNTVTLYTERYDPETMKQVEVLLTNNLIPFSRSSDFDDDQLLFITEYVVELDDLEDS